MRSVAYFVGGPWDLSKRVLAPHDAQGDTIRVGGFDPYSAPLDGPRSEHVYRMDFAPRELDTPTGRERAGVYFYRGEMRR